MAPRIAGGGLWRSVCGMAGGAKAMASASSRGGPIGRFFPLRPGLVEGLLFLLDVPKEEQPFDKLRANGVLGRFNDLLLIKFIPSRSRRAGRSGRSAGGQGRG